MLTIYFEYVLRKLRYILHDVYYETGVCFLSPHIDEPIVCGCLKHMHFNKIFVVFILLSNSNIFP